MYAHLLISFALLTAPESACSETATVMAIQGRGHTSPLHGDTVVTTGVTTVVTRDGFYIEDPDGDGDPATSDGLFVYMRSAPAVEPGDRVRIEGVVHEYRPGNHPHNLTVTEMNQPAVTILSAGNTLPSPVRLGRGGRLPPTEVIDDDGLTRFQPATDGIDFYESLEGMRVLVPDAVAASVTNRYGEVWVLADAGASATGGYERGGITVSPGDFNPERIQLDDTLLPGSFPLVETGDRLGDVTGVVSYRFGGFEVLPTTLGQPGPARHRRETTELRPGSAQLTVASFNARNLDGRDEGRVRALAAMVVDHLRAPDIVVLEEVQDDSGASGDGTVAATRTWNAITAAVLAAGGPAYDFRDIAPENNRDGGAPGANIRVGLLFQPARVTFVDRGTASATDATAVIDTGNGPALSLSPGRIEPTAEAWRYARKPLAAELSFAGRRFFLVGCHFSSRSGSSPLFGAIQPPIVERAEKRQAQAEIVRDLVVALLAIDPDAPVIVAGDFNDFQFSPAMTALAGPLTNLTDRLPAPQRYSYNFEGNSQALDHILVSRSLAVHADYDIVHACAGFAGSVSDHDPVLARVWLTPSSEGSPAPLAAFPNPFSTATTLHLTNATADVDAAVFDIAGRHVRQLRLSAGAGGVAQAIWDGRDDRGRAVASGVYLVRSAGRSIKVVRVQ